MTDQKRNGLVAMAGGKISPPQNGGPSREELIELVIEEGYIGESGGNEDEDREVAGAYVDAYSQQARKLWKQKQREIVEAKAAEEAEKKAAEEAEKKKLAEVARRVAEKLASMEAKERAAREADLDKRIPKVAPSKIVEPDSRPVAVFAGPALVRSDDDTKFDTIVDQLRGYLPDELFQSVENAWAFRGHLAGRLRVLRKMVRDEEYLVEASENIASPELVDFLKLLLNVLDKITDKLSDDLLQEGYSVDKFGTSPQITFKAMGEVMKKFPLTQYAVLFTFGTRQEMLAAVEDAHKQLKSAWNNAEVWAAKRTGIKVEKTDEEKVDADKKVSTEKKLLLEILEVLTSALSNQKLDLERLTKRLMRKRGDLTDAKAICQRFAVNKQIQAEVEEPDGLDEHGLHPTAWAVARSKRLGLSRDKFRELIQAEKEKRERLSRDRRQEWGFGSTSKPTNQVAQKAAGQKKNKKGSDGQKGGRGNGGRK